MKKFILIFCMCSMLFTYFVFDVSAIDATSDWNSVSTIMIGDSFSSLAEQPLFSTIQEVSAGAAFNISIPLAGDDWQIDPTQPIEVRFMLMMVSGTVNYNSSSKKLNSAYFSDKVQGVTSPDEIESYNYTEYSYFCSFDPAVRLTESSWVPGVPDDVTNYVSSENGIYTGRGYFFDVVINANAFSGATPKSIQFDVTKFTTQTGDSTFVFCPYVAVRNIIPGTLEYLEQILQAIIDLQSNGGISAADAKQAIIEAIEETLMSTPAQNAAAQALASEIADKVLAGEDVLEELQELNRPDPDEIGNVADLDQVISSDDIEEYTTVFEAIMQSNIVLSMLLACCTIALISLVLYGKKA